MNFYTFVFACILLLFVVQNMDLIFKECIDPNTGTITSIETKDEMKSYNGDVLLIWIKIGEKTYVYDSELKKVVDIL